MTTPLVVPYTSVRGPFPTDRPPLPIELSFGAARLREVALVDSGSDTCVLPHRLGLRLGLDWSNLPPLPSPGGLVTGTAARAALLGALVPPLPAVRLAFAWVQRDDVPLILGQVNFFLEFDVCFFRRRGEFHIQPATP